MLKKITLLLSMSLILLLNGCQTTNPYTGEQEVNKTGQYGGIGAVAGAIIGGIADGGKGALRGAALGGAVGGGYGYYTDRQENALRQHLRNTGVQVSRQGNNLRLIMPGNITFDTGKSAIKASFYPVLGSIATIFKQFNRNLIQVVGFTDNRGSSKINLPLSLNRAQSVAAYLSSQGISNTRIVTTGMGALHPIASNKTPAGRSKNRRVEINILPKPKP